MSKDKTGALITFERRQSLQDFINTGVKVSASIKAELLTTIFYEGTPLHDGATIIKNDMIVASACFYFLLIRKFLHSMEQDIERPLVLVKSLIL